ncbi:type VI secretion system amidase effector protein Tae4 [Burkholderia cepacia]|uniref:type VI secretion system amidase effector protein Tae4 n=1 Tax=Burkholderia cepacia TaxID=292 RepID=UPI001E6476A5|nr:type VI secretion system amidase effector protein Tae4 [Burkholderia cepacia]
MKPPFSILSSHYPGNKTVSREALFSGIGLARPDPESVVCEYVRHPDQRGTCQKRNNVARRTGHSERAAPWAPNRGGASQAGQDAGEPAYFGKAEVFRRDDAVTGIASRKGMAAFWNIPGYMNGRGGHIDLIDGARAICGSDCYWTASEMWFWPLR